MGIGFNPSSNKYTDSLMSMLGTLALEEYKDTKKTARTNELIKRLTSGGNKASGGLMGQGAYISGYDDEGNPKISVMDPKSQMEYGQMQKFFGEGMNNVSDANFTEMPKEAAMSLPGGRIGDLFGNPVQMPAAQSRSPMFQDYKPESYSAGRMTYKRQVTPQEEEKALQKDLEKTKRTELLKGPSEGASGKVALAKESLKNLADVKKILFPDGTSKSFKRTTAFASNLPGGTLPMLPQRGWGKAEQEVFRKMSTALSARQLIQTGVAARPEETTALIKQFTPSVGSDPTAAFNGITQLEDFYKEYLRQSDPETRFGQSFISPRGSSDQSQDPLGIR